MLFTVLCPNSLMLPFVSLEERNINAAGKKKIYILELFITYRLPVLILISTLIVYLFFCHAERKRGQPKEWAKPADVWTMGTLDRSAYPTSVYQSLIKPRQLLLQR